MTEAYVDELKDAKEKLSIQSRDKWRTPAVDGSQIFSAYLETRPEVVLEEDDQLIYLDTVWAFVSTPIIIDISKNFISINCDPSVWSHRTVTNLLSF